MTMTDPIADMLTRIVMNRVCITDARKHIRK